MSQVRPSYQGGWTLAVHVNSVNKFFNPMKSLLVAISGIALLAGCNRQSIPTSVTPPAPVAFEYSVQLYEMPSSPQNIASAKIDAENAHRDLLLAQISHQLRTQEISESEAKDSNAMARADFKVNIENINWHAEYEKAQALTEGINSKITNGWELVSMVPASVPDKYLLILKRPQK